MRGPFLALLLAAPLAAGCYGPTKNANVDGAPTRDAASSTDGVPQLDGSVDAPLNPTLARMPKDCNTEVAEGSVAATFPGWHAHVYDPAPFNAAMPGDPYVTLNAHRYRCNEVWKLSLSYSKTNYGNGAEPAAGPAWVFLRDMDHSPATFEMAYTVEAMKQTGQATPQMVGGFTLGLASSQYTVMYLARRVDGMLQVRTIQNDNTINETNIGSFTPPFRVRWQVAKSNISSSISAVVTVMTANQNTVINVPAQPFPTTTLQLQFGITSHTAGAASELTVSDLVLP